MKISFVALGLVVVVAMIAAGCSSTNQNAGAAGSPPGGSNPVSPSATTGSPSVQQTLTPASQQENTFVSGDIIAKVPNEGTSAKIVYGYNAVTKKYLLDTIYSDRNNQWGYRLYPNLESENRKWVEDTYPHKIARISLGSLVTQYPDEAAWNAALHPTAISTLTITPTATPGDSSFIYSSGGGCPPGECWVNGFYRQNGVYVRGHCTSC